MRRCLYAGPISKRGHVKGGGGYHSNVRKKLTYSIRRKASSVLSGALLTGRAFLDSGGGETNLGEKTAYSDFEKGC